MSTHPASKTTLKGDRTSGILVPGILLVFSIPCLDQVYFKIIGALTVYINFQTSCVFLLHFDYVTYMFVIINIFSTSIVRFNKSHSLIQSIIQYIIL